LRKTNFTAWVFLAPALLFFIIFSIYPILRSIQLSFYDADAISKTFVGLKNYIKVFTSPRMLNAFLNTGKFMIVVVPCVAFIPLFIAMIGYRMPTALQTGVRFAYYIPVLTAGPIVAMIWSWLMNPDGAVNFIVGRQVFWLASNPAAFWTMCAMIVSVDMGMTIIIYMAALSTVNPELYDAAKLDGCTQFQEDWYITIPSILPTVAFMFFVKLVGVSQVWMYPFIMTGGGPNYGTDTVVLEIYLQAFQYGKYGYASAIGVIFTICVAVLAVIQRRYFKGGAE